MVESDQSNGFNFLTIMGRDRYTFFRRRQWVTTDLIGTTSDVSSSGCCTQSQFYKDGNWGRKVLRQDLFRLVVMDSYVVVPPTSQ